jgi:type IV pilus assembly protein PilM
MAKVPGVWGIDIGQCGLKALRCVPTDNDDRVKAEAFDYIEYPKILSQPEADAPALIREALQEFLSRNQVRGDKVAISVPGQNGLARFIKLPPVESKKIAAIVRFEARQQIPFDLDDVIWDYQLMPGGSEEEGFVLETEVGLFAMKREQVQRALRPFDELRIEVDIIQLAPLALYNFVAFDQMPDLPPVEQYDPDQPPDSLLVISLGTETTDLVITNGYRVWQRSLPIGGSHFTKALTKELKQTYAKAEHTKRNATKAENPKALFQSMRPVFNDLVTEIQRSLNFFSNIDRKARVTRGLALGNGMKLPGLVRYLSQNLNLPIERLESFTKLEGPGVLDAPAFQENILSFGTCYGLCLQGLMEPQIHTNLVPPERIKERMIRAKKPWAVGAAAALLLGLTISALGQWRAWSTAAATEEVTTAEREATTFTQQVGTNRQTFQQLQTRFNTLDQIGKHILQPDQRRELWLELFEAVQAAMPRLAPGAEDPTLAKPRVEQGALGMTLVAVPDPQLYITEFTSKEGDLAQWFSNNRQWYRNPLAENASGAAAAGTEGTPPGAAATSSTAGTETPDAGPTGLGWIITLRGVHYHNPRSQADFENQGLNYLQRTIIRNLHQKTLEHPTQPGVRVPVKDLGIGYAMVIDPKTINFSNFVPNPYYDPKLPEGGLNSPQMLKPSFEFRIEFCWVPRMAEERQQVAPAVAAGAGSGAEPATPAAPPAAAP